VRDGLHRERNCRRFFPELFDPGQQRVVWGWRHPRNALAPIVLNECPVSYVTRESEWWVSQFTAARVLRTPLIAGGLLSWPARAVDALLLLETENNLEKHAEITLSPDHKP
jgi:hypothetical protein